MKRALFRISGVLMALLLCVQLTATAFAAGNLNARIAAGQAAAEELYALGLFRGVGTLPDGSPDFALARTPSRGEAVTMLVRLLGGEREAVLADYFHYFQDAGWADSYIGYAYYHEITKGVSDTAFGTASDIGLDQFLTLILRALGYTSVSWKDPYPTTKEAKLDYPSGLGFYRADVAVICLDALDCVVKGEGITLRAKLEAAGVIGGSQATPKKSFQNGPATELVEEITVTDEDDLAAKLALATRGLAPTITIHVPVGQEEALKKSINRYDQGISFPLSDVYIPTCTVAGDGLLLFQPTYCDSSQVIAVMEGRTGDVMSAEQVALGNAAKHALASVAEPSMSEYELVKAIHDYVGDHTEYKLQGARSHTAAGCLIDGTAVCDGYADAVDLMCYLAGIDCIRIIGWSSEGVTHAWNKVKVDGQWYNMDATWDDQKTSTQYFLISDEAIGADHTWTDYDFWPAAPNNYN